VGMEEKGEDETGELLMNILVYCRTHSFYAS